MAEPISKERLEALRVLYEDVAKATRQFYPDTEGEWFRASCERSKGYLHGVGGFGLIASGTIGSYREFDLIAKLLNEMPAISARIAQLEAALEPFANAARGAGSAYPDADQLRWKLHITLTMGDIRQALAALEAKPSPG